MQISDLIPHQGSMCLLQSVQSCDQQRICCTSFSHLDRDNPLRAQQQLAALHLAEYGAQAAALHGPWLAHMAGRQAPAGGGYLAAIKQLSWQRARIDDLPAEQPLLVEAERLLESAEGLIYQFRASHNAEPLASGRLLIALHQA